METGCDVKYRNISTLICSTTPGRPGETFDVDSMKLSIDNSTAAMMGNFTFSYLADPVIISVTHEKGVFRLNSRFC
jgi:hypothetical protein